MFLSSYGLISLDGSVTKPEPSQDFDSYQDALQRYWTTLALKKRIEKEQRQTASCSREVRCPPPER